MKRSRISIAIIALLVVVGAWRWIAVPGGSVEPGMVYPSTGAGPGADPVAPAVAPENSAAPAVEERRQQEELIKAQRARLAYGQEWSGSLPAGMTAFREWTGRYGHASNPAERQNLETEGVALARARRPEMLSMIENDPRRALAVTVPMPVRETLPAAVLAQLEERVAGRGDLQQLCAMPPAGGRVAGRIYRQLDVGGSTYNVHLYGRRENQQTKSGASVHGIAMDHEFALHEIPVRMLEEGETPATTVEARCPVTGRAVAAGSEALLVEVQGSVWPLTSVALLPELERRLVAGEDLPGPGVPPISNTAPVPVPEVLPLPPTSWTTGNHTLLVIRVDFSDSTGGLMTQQAGLDLVNNSVSPYYDQASFGVTSLTPTVTTNVYRMPQTGATYETGNQTTQLYNDAVAAAGADYTVANYQHVMIVFKRINGSNWTWAGLGNVGGGHTWVNGYYDFRVTAHELGHNYGLSHANAWQVNDGNPVSDAGSTVEYADPYDVMGGGNTTGNNHYGPWFKNRLGWLPDSAVTAVTSSGTYRIARFDNKATPTNQPLALTIFRDGTHTYWVGFRQNFTTNASLFSGAYVQWGFNSSQQSQLLDMTTPGTSLNDAGLSIGTSFNDSAYGITIHPTAKGGTAPSEYLDVDVTINSSGNPFVIGWGSSSPSTPPSGLTGVTALAAGASHSLALKNDGTVVGWGSNSSGQITIPAGLSGVASIAAGGSVSGAVKSDGTVVLWGSSTYGQTTVPGGLSGVSQLAIGTNHVLALKNDGTVVAWGNNAMGQTTIPVSAASGVVAIAAGQQLSAAVKSNGTVVTWGANYGSQPAGLSGVTAIASGGYHYVALKSDGTVVAWGNNASGETNVPAGLSGVVAVAGGDFHSLALKSDGTVVGWGSNGSSQATPPAGMPHVQAICGGAYHSLALTGTFGAPAFSVQPSSRSIVTGTTTTFTVAASGTPTPTLQWQREPSGSPTWSNLPNGGAYSGANGGSLTVTSATTLMSGDQFRCVASNSTGIDATSAAATLTVSNAMPAISAQPTSRTVVAGSSTTLLVTATISGGGTLSYQWQLNGVNIAGATSASYTLPVAQSFQGGIYTVVVTAGGNSVTSSGATLTVKAAPPSAARLLNLSTRAECLTGSDALIPGFVLSGSGAKSMLIRGIGPTLGSFGVSGTLVDPQITLMAGTNTIAVDDDWGTNANKAQIVSTTSAVGAFALIDGAKDAALLVNLAAGSYTVPMSGAAGGTGVAMIELYDADSGVPTTTLINISNRGFVGTGGNIMIPGFVVSAEGSKTLLIRAVGPTLSGFGVGGVLADPVLTVVDNNSVAILSNDDWGSNPQSATTASVAAQVGAFALANGSKDAAFVVTLPPGVYTVQASGKNNSSGTALVEIYVAP